MANMRSSRDLLLGFTLAAALLAGCAPSEQETDFLARKAVLLRQNQGMRELIAEAEQGTLVPPDRFLVGIDEEVVADVLRSQLPLERPLGKRFIVRLESATVLLRDKYGIITIEGEVHRRADPGAADRRAHLGGLGARRRSTPRPTCSTWTSPSTGSNCSRRACSRTCWAPAARSSSPRRGRRLLQDALPTLKIPVALAQTIRHPGHPGRTPSSSTRSRSRSTCPWSGSSRPAASSG